MEEFSIGLTQLNLNLSEDDNKMLFARFQTNLNDQVIDFKEFVTFFEGPVTKVHLLNMPIITVIDCQKKYLHLHILTMG